MARTELSTEAPLRIAASKSRHVAYAETLPTLSDVFALNPFDDYLKIVRSVKRFKTGEQIAKFRDLEAAKEGENLELADELRTEIILRNLGLPVSIARKYQHHGVEIEDLVLHGNLGLIDAVDAFDVTRGLQFSTLATFLVRKEIQDVIADMGSPTFRVPYQMRTRMRDVKIMRGDLMAEFRGRKPTDEEVAKRLGISTNKIASSDKAMETMKGVSLDKPIEAGLDGDTFADVVSDPDQPEVINLATGKLALPHIIRRVNELPPLEFEIFTRRIGLQSGEEELFTVIGKEVGVTSEDAGRIFKATLKALQAEFGEQAA